MKYFITYQTHKHHLATAQTLSDVHPLEWLVAKIKADPLANYQLLFWSEIPEQLYSLYKDEAL